VNHPIFQPVHASWFPILDPLQEGILSAFKNVSQGEFIPAVNRILAPLSSPLDDVKVVIVGQDPYPNADYADGFAFSVRPEILPFPASLVNIFKELESDLGTPMPSDGNLEVASRGAVGILWGGNAQQMSDYFDPVRVITSAHPSPLSAYRGFFGSKPFSQCNSLLEEMGKTQIIW
jgi:uracil-DNA glycosylase